MTSENLKDCGCVFGEPCKVECFREANVQIRENRRRPQSAGACLVSFKPLASIALAVHKKQIKEATELAAKKGVPTDFTTDGRPVFTSSRHFRRYARLHGFQHFGYA